MEQSQATPAAPRTERRKSPRYACEGVLKIEWGSAVLEARVRDLSAGGMRVEMAEPLWVGARFSAELVVDTPLRLDCQVRRVEPGRGMGLEHALRDEMDRGRLEALLSTLAQR